MIVWCVVVANYKDTFGLHFFPFLSSLRSLFSDLVLTVWHGLHNNCNLLSWHHMRFTKSSSVISSKLLLIGTTGSTWSTWTLDFASNSPQSWHFTQNLTCFRFASCRLGMMLFWMIWRLRSDRPNTRRIAPFIRPLSLVVNLGFFNYALSVYQLNVIFVVNNSFYCFWMVH